MFSSRIYFDLASSIARCSLAIWPSSCASSCECVCDYSRGESLLDWVHLIVCIGDPIWRHCMNLVCCIECELFFPTTFKWACGHVLVQRMYFRYARLCCTVCGGNFYATTLLCNVVRVPWWCTMRPVFAHRERAREVFERRQQMIAHLEALAEAHIVI